MTRPRLLAVSGIRPWPVRGGFSLRPAHLLEALAEDWDISLVVAADTDPELVKWPRPDRHEIVSAPTAGRWRAVPSRRVDYDPLRQAVAAILAAREPDAALLFNGTEFLAFGCTEFPPVVGDRIDCRTLERLRYVRRNVSRAFKTVAEAAAAARYERRLVRELAATTVVGEDDRRALGRVSKRDSIHVVPNGVHVPDGTTDVVESPVPTVAFTGTLSYSANADAMRFFVDSMWPSIRSRVEGSRLILAGRNPTRLTSRLGNVAGVEVRVDVPDMFALLRESWVAVAPMRCGTGVKNKVLEAWAVARPVVMTPLTANGLGLYESSGDLIAKDPSQFCEHVVRLLRDPALRRRHGAAGQERARTHHTWRQSSDRLSHLLRAVSGLDR